MRRDTEQTETIQLESEVSMRYSAGASEVEPALCCPTSYDPKYLAAIPMEVIERDYGCGDPSKFLRSGETVLDLGSGTGKICFIASQVVGETGQVIGIDMTQEMLNVAGAAAPKVAEAIGYANVRFHRARIQDLRLDPDWLDEHLAAQPVACADALKRLEAVVAHRRNSKPLIADESIDVVVSNCVLNLVRNEDKQDLFSELYRVLRQTGRAVISDIVCDEEVPKAMQENPELWSGCVSGALREDHFLAAFEMAGFHGIQVLERQAQPWRVVEGIEFRSVTVVAYKGKDGPCLERGQAVIYRGPFRDILDDDGHRFVRGQTVAVCDKTFQLLRKPPYERHFTHIEPAIAIPIEEAKPFACGVGTQSRSAAELKGAGSHTGRPDLAKTSHQERCC